MPSLFCPFCKIVVDVAVGKESPVHDDCGVKLEEKPNDFYVKEAEPKEAKEPQKVEETK